jgi:hypothetical protein
LGRGLFFWKISGKNENGMVVPAVPLLFLESWKASVPHAQICNANAKRQNRYRADSGLYIGIVFSCYDIAMENKFPILFFGGDKVELFFWYES